MDNIIAGTMRIKTIGLVLAVVASVAQTGFSTDQRRGIDFFDGNWKEGLKKAETEKKPVFVYLYAKWCGQCKQLKRGAFKSEEAGKYFNKNFINVAVDGETPEGAKIMRSYNVKSYPTLLIVDARGNLLSKTTGNMKPYILINFGRRIVP